MDEIVPGLMAKIKNLEGRIEALSQQCGYTCQRDGGLHLGMGGDGTLEQTFYVPKIECEMEECHELAANFVWFSDTGTTILLCKRHYRAKRDGDNSGTD